MRTRINLSKLEEDLGYVFTNKKWLMTSLTHSSYSYNHPEVKDFERLEFLGDAVLKLVVSHKLFVLYPEMSEGDMSKLRAYLVSDKHLTKIAKKLNLQNYLLIGSSERTIKDSILSASFEAILGAVYMDSSLKQCYKIIDKLMNIKIEEYEEDSKTVLQELTQSLFGVLPEYKVIDVRGPSHSPIFEVQLSIDNKFFYTATGSSKKQAQSEAAKKALNDLRNIRRDNID
ncbi:Ribonuclease 3 [Thermodesulfobium narugense DSM 14796]|uniref:Ribonuclease 3 n=1 Tax=Thermodesulfobium narugense DSM 14796 TaxID=747365 RepID=M1E908_9BACT|nr:ribonuclease III [Thermodesulfobium narugense]AEE15250.1 Ribonuclease 3 [Thermodesulfobium narugense DSM 14796]